MEGTEVSATHSARLRPQSKSLNRESFSPAHVVVSVDGVVERFRTDRSPPLPPVHSGHRSGPLHSIGASHWVERSRMTPPSSKPPVTTDRPTTSRSVPFKTLLT